MRERERAEDERQSLGEGSASHALPQPHTAAYSQFTEPEKAQLFLCFPHRRAGERKRLAEERMGAFFGNRPLALQIPRVGEGLQPLSPSLSAMRIFFCRCFCRHRRTSSLLSVALIWRNSTHPSCIAEHRREGRSADPEGHCTCAATFYSGRAPRTLPVLQAALALGRTGAVM